MIHNNNKMITNFKINNYKKMYKINMINKFKI